MSLTVNEIADLFKRGNYKWKFTDGHRVPTRDEIQTTILNAIDALKDEGNNTQVEMGRLIVKKSGQFYDVYVHLAEYQ